MPAGEVFAALALVKTACEHYGRRFDVVIDSCRRLPSCRTRAIAEI